MQVTKNEKIVKVVQEETYDIKGLSKVEAIALLLLLSKSTGTQVYPIYRALDESLKMNNEIHKIIPAIGQPILLHKVHDKIIKLAQE